MIKTDNSFELKPIRQHLYQELPFASRLTALTSSVISLIVIFDNLYFSRNKQIF